MRPNTVAVTLALTAFAASASGGVRGSMGRTHSFADTAIPFQPLSPTAWLVDGIERDERFRLPPDPSLALLQRYMEPAVERTPDWRSYFRGRYGVSSWRFSTSTALAWSATSCEPGHATSPITIQVPGLGLTYDLPLIPAPLDTRIIAPSPEPAPPPELLAVTRAKPCPKWRQVHPVTLGRYGGEADTFALLDCDGSVAPEALDRLSVIARPPGTERPELPLPVDPDPGAEESGEWVADVKMLHPRLAWVVERIAEAFPRHAIYVISGYRREASRSLHAQGRALDLFVMGVPNTDLFRFCHKQLHDVGCGFYPNNKFVHVDVRPYGTGHPMWIDVSRPGTPSEYVDSWPGVVEAGALSFAGEE